MNMYLKCILTENLYKKMDLYDEYFLDSICSIIMCRFPRTQVNLIGHHVSRLVAQTATMGVLIW